MSAVPAAVVRARRTTGVILLASSLAAIIAVVVAVGTWLTAPPVVRPIPSNQYGAAGGQYSATAGVPVASGPSAPALSAHDQLVVYLTNDAATVTGVPDGYWVPQLASNRVGLDRTGHSWDEQAILDDHEHWRTYGGTLLWSADFATYKGEDYWVTVVPSQASSTAEAVLAWCEGQQIGGDNCLAKRLSTSSPYTGDNTRHRR
jgi:hypothetical protein